MITMSPQTYLFVPADKPALFAKAMASGTDRVILDLEDAVYPSGKAAARAAIVAADLDWDRVVIRVNAPGSAFWADDLKALLSVRSGTVMVPKAERAIDLAAVAAALGRTVEILPLIETARGLDQVKRLLVAPGVNRVAFGHLDFALDLGLVPDPEALLYFRSHLVWASRLADRLPPIDGVTVAIDDDDALRRDAIDARRLGFGGKLLIHPRQVTTVRDAFAPTDKEIAWAQRVIDAVEQNGTGAIKVDGRMVDRPVEKAARAILQKHRRRQENCDV
jgi:citrate lyase subunit beta / citryl-CoA lyase